MKNVWSRHAGTYVVLIVVMVLFGGRKLPDLATGMGKAIGNFKKASTKSEEIYVVAAKGTAGKTATEEGRGEGSNLFG